MSDDKDKEIARLKRKANKYRNAIRWALGEVGDIGNMPQAGPNGLVKRYWWRTGLRKRAGDLAREK